MNDAPPDEDDKPGPVWAPITATWKQLGAVAVLVVAALALCLATMLALSALVTTAIPTRTTPTPGITEGATP